MAEDNNPTLQAIARDITLAVLEKYPIERKDNEDTGTQAGIVYKAVLTKVVEANKECFATKPNTLTPKSLI